jgi:hypothetical protein
MSREKISAIPQEHLGITFRSRTEARWAEFFHLVDVEFQYEPDGFRLEDDWYVPDFYLPFANIYFEVKPTEPTVREVRVAKALAAAAKAVVVVGCGNPREDVDLVAFDSVGRQTFVEFSHDNTVSTVWIGEAQVENCWQVPLSANCTSRGYYRSSHLDEAGKLQFNKPHAHFNRPSIDAERRVVSRRDDERRVIRSREPRIVVNRRDR